MSSKNINTKFGTKVRFKKDYQIGECVEATPEDVFQIANYWHKRYIQLHHKQLAELVKIKYEEIDELLEEVNHE